MSMFRTLDPDTALVWWRPGDGPKQWAAVGRDGVPHPHGPPAEPSFEPWDGCGPEPEWTGARFAERAIELLDEMRGLSRLVPCDPEALEMPDPGYCAPTGATPLGNGLVAITILRCEHIALLDCRTGEVTLETFPGSGGGNPVGIVDGGFWFTNYDTLCRLDIETLEGRSSPVLQPSF